MGCFRVSIPFASGHSFEHSITSAQSAINIKSQSPSHRGTHSNPTIQTNFVVPVGNTELSQSPSHRGTHSNEFRKNVPWEKTRWSQSPSHRGTHSNPRPAFRSIGKRSSLNPLRIGALIRTVWIFQQLPHGTTLGSQSPSHRGTHSNREWSTRQRSLTKDRRLNPLRIGALIRTTQDVVQSGVLYAFGVSQSPSHRGTHSNQRTRLGALIRTRAAKVRRGDG